MRAGLADGLAYALVALRATVAATAGMATSGKVWSKTSQNRHRQPRVDELNSMTCGGMSGVTDTFATMLWHGRR